jgi:hypothetical protein
MNCFIVFSITGMVFGVLSRNGWEEQFETKPTGDRSRVTECGEKQRGTIR